MCISPILIKNPNYGRDPKKGVSRLFDCTNTHIAVPCGTCHQCIHARQQIYVQRTHIESLDSFLFFFTLTYNNEHLPVLQHPVHGEIKHFRVSDFQNMFKRLRKHPELPSFRYLTCLEYGGKYHRPHAHGIISVKRPELLPHSPEYTSYIRNTEDVFYRAVKLEWRVNTGSTRNPIYEPLFTPVIRYNSYNYDLHYVENDTDNNVTFYVSKYATKFDTWFTKFDTLLKKTLEPSEYFDIHNLIRPRLLVSKSYGQIDTPQRHAYIRKCIDNSKVLNFAFPTFIDNNGKTSPLIKAYRKYVTVDDMDTILLNTQPHADNHHDTTPDTIHQITLKAQSETQKERSFKKSLKKIAQKNEDENI